LGRERIERDSYDVVCIKARTRLERRRLEQEPADMKELAYFTLEPVGIQHILQAYDSRRTVSYVDFVGSSCSFNPRTRILSWRGYSNILNSLHIDISAGALRKAIAYQAFTEGSQDALIRVFSPY